MTPELLAGVGQEGPAIVPADGSAQEGFDAHQLQQQLSATEQDRDKARKQLNRYALMIGPVASPC